MSHFFPKCLWKNTFDKSYCEIISFGTHREFFGRFMNIRNPVKWVNELIQCSSCQNNREIKNKSRFYYMFYIYIYIYIYMLGRTLKKHSRNNKQNMSYSLTLQMYHQMKNARAFLSEGDFVICHLKRLQRQIRKPELPTLRKWFLEPLCICPNLEQDQFNS